MKVILRRSVVSWKVFLGRKRFGFQETGPDAEKGPIHNGETLLSRLKDEFGAWMIYVLGNRNVLVHLINGVLALRTDQLFQSTP